MENDRNGYSHPAPSTAVRSPAGTTRVEAEDAQTYAQADAQEVHALPPIQPIRSPWPLTLTNGNSVGVQSEKVTELGPETTILDLDTDTGLGAARSQVGDPKRGSGQSVMHTTWHPKESTVLATAGEALARIWTISRFEGPKQHVDLLEAGNRSMVTALSWSPDGEFLAVATRSLESGWIGEVTIWTKAGVMRDVLPAAHDMMLALRWNTSGSLLLAVASSGNASSVLVWDPSTGQALQPVELERTIVDAAWTGDIRYAVCGEAVITEFVINDRTAAVAHDYARDEIRQSWSIIRFDPLTLTLAVAAEENAHLAVRTHSNLNGPSVTTLRQHVDYRLHRFRPNRSYTLRRTDRNVLPTSSEPLHLFFLRYPASCHHFARWHAQTMGCQESLQSSAQAVNWSGHAGYGVELHPRRLSCCRGELQ